MEYTYLPLYFRLGTSVYVLVEDGECCWLRCMGSSLLGLWSYDRLQGLLEVMSRSPCRLWQVVLLLGLVLGSCSGGRQHHISIDCATIPFGYCSAVLWVLTYILVCMALLCSAHVLHRLTSGRFEDFDYQAHYLPQPHAGHFRLYQVNHVANIEHHSLRTNQAQSIVYCRLPLTYTQARHIPYPLDPFTGLCDSVPHSRTDFTSTSQAAPHTNQANLQKHHHPQSLTNPLSTLSAKLISPPVTSLTNSVGGSNSMT